MAVTSNLKRLAGCVLLASGCYPLGLLASWPPSSGSYPDGPPIRHSGGFGEPSCRACHAGGGDAPPPVVDLTGLPAAFEPGRTYDLTITVRRDGLERAGFQLAARFAPGTLRVALPAGVLALSDTARTGLDRDSTAARTLFYARHTRRGTVVAPAGAQAWRLRWTAPAGREAVVFHVAVVAANDDDSAFGDDVAGLALFVPAAAR